jgi:hypothetical protein
MGLWTKARLCGQGEAEPGLEAAEEMLNRKNHYPSVFSDLFQYSGDFYLVCAVLRSSCLKLVAAEVSEKCQKH